MKVQCSCGAKYEFAVTPVMATSPVKFVCPACGLNASEFVDGLIRRELGQTNTPTGVPVPIQLAAPPRPTAAPAPAPVATLLDESPPPPPPPTSVRRPPGVRLSSSTAAPVAAEQAAAEAPAGVPCLKHPGQIATEKCFVCSKPICPKCMELFGYLCSPLCKAKADSHGLNVPIYENQRSMVEARQWRKVVWVGSGLGAVAAVLLGFWFWYAWFGCMPRVVFSVRFPDRKYSGQSVLCGKDNQEVVFLHGGTLARYEIKSKQPVWSLYLLDTNQFVKEAEDEVKSVQASNLRLRDHGVQDLIRLPPMDKLIAQYQRSAEAGLNLYVRGQNIWVASPGKITRYDWDNGKQVKELAVQSRYGGVIARGDDLMMVDVNSRRPIVTRIDLVNGESHIEDIAGPEAKALANAGTNASGTLASAKPSRGTPSAGLPVGMPGKDMDKAMDPGRVAEEVSHLSTPARIALPAVLANSMSQERTLAALKDDQRTNASNDSGPDSSLTLIPTKDSFVQFGVKLLEHRIIERSAMKAAPGKSALEGNVTAGRSLEVAQDLLNEMQRERGGDKVQEDESRYQVTIRKPASEESWTGEVVGPPKLFPLDTVNVLTANRTVIVFDKANRKLWQGALSYNVERGLGALDEESATYGQGPCVQHKGTLYVFDQAVLTAFDLNTGNVRWRYPSVGIAGLFFDEDDNIYVNTTTASPDSIKYSRQIDLSDKANNQVVKLDPRNGKVLWNVQPGGLVNYVHGKIILVVQSYAPFEEDEDDSGPMSAFATPAHLRIRRLNPRNGQEVWEYFQQRAPLDVGFENNTVRLVFRKEVQVLKFMTF